MNGPLGYTPIGSLTSSKKTVTVQQGYGPAISTTTVTTNRSPGIHSINHSIPTIGNTVRCELPLISLTTPSTWISSLSPSVQPSSSSLGDMTQMTTRVQRYEWLTGPDGIMRQYLIEDSETTSPTTDISKRGSIESTSTTMTKETLSSGGLSSWQPTIRCAPVEIDIERKLSLESELSADASITATKSDDAIEEENEAKRIARMRVAAEKLMLQTKLEKIKEEKNQEEARRLALEKEISELQHLNPRSIEERLEMVMKEIEQLKIQKKTDENTLRFQIEKEIEEKRKFDEKERRKQMEMEMERLRQMEDEKTQILEEHIRQLKDTNQTEGFCNEKDQELLEIKQQRELIHQSMKIEEQAAKLTSTVSKQADHFIAIDHPFKSIILKIHSLSSLTPDVLQVIGGNSCWVRFSLGSNRLEVQSNNRNSSDNSFEWDDLLSFPYMNEKYLKITLETAPNGSGIIVGGVKIDMEDFLLNPNEMCGQHHIPIVTPEAQPAGTITITLQLSLEFIAKSFVAVRPKPVPSSSSTHRFSSEAIQHHVSNMTINQPIVLSSLVTPYKSIKVDIRTISCTKEQLKDVNRISCLVKLGNTSLSSPQVQYKPGAQWNLNFGLPFNSEKFIGFNISTFALRDGEIPKFHLDHNPQFESCLTEEIMGTSQVDLDTLLMSGNATHAVNVALKKESQIVGYLPVTIEFSTESTAAYAKESSSWSSSTSTRSFGDGRTTSANQLMNSMMQMLESPTVKNHPELRSSSFGSILTDTGSGWGLLPMNYNSSILPHLNEPMIQSQTDLMIPRPTNCKVQINHVHDLIHEVKNSGFVPLVKVTLLGNQAQTSEPKITGSNSAKWRTSKGCFNFQIDVNKILESVKTNPDLGNLNVEVWDTSSSDRLLIGTAQVSLLPIITVSTGYFSGDVQLTKNSDGHRYGLANLKIQTF